LLAIAGVGYWFLRPESVQVPTTEATPSPQSPSEVVAPELRAYMDQAKGGDAKAMHLIALMYWNGLNVRQDRVKGLDWYQKAATAGDKAAQKELKVIKGK
jgi:Sel1 repeat